MPAPLDNDTALQTHRGGRYTGSNGQAPYYARHPSLTVAASSGGGGDPVFESASTIPLPGFTHLASGNGPVWIEVKFSDTGVRSEQYWYRDANGVSQMTTGNSVGSNAAAVKTQSVGSFGADYFASGADLTITAADLIGDAVAAGALARKADGTSRAALATDFIVRIDVDLKPIGGHVDVAGVQTPTTASDATHERGGGVYDIDPGGSSSLGEMRDAAGYLIEANTGDIVVKNGSGVVISFDFASLPA